MQFLKKKFSPEKNSLSHLWGYVCVLDFEATCDNTVKNFDNEVIEFPSVLLQWDPLKRNYYKISEFQVYCKPLVDSKVSAFCTDLTGITQDTVNKGITFIDALTQHQNWLLKECTNDTSIGPSGSPEITFEDNVMIVTCGAWDLATLFPKEIKRWMIPNPNKVYQRFINIKNEFAKHYNIDGFGMGRMLMHLRIPLEGRHHSGIDDCRNIAKIWERLIQDGYDATRPHVTTVPKESYKIHPQKQRYLRYRELIAKRTAQLPSDKK